MNIQSLCCKLRSLSCLGKPNLYSRYISVRTLHVTAPRLAATSPSTSTSTSTSTPNPETPPTTTASTTTSTDLFRQALQDAQDQAPAKKQKKREKKEEAGVRRATCTMNGLKGSPYKMALILNQIRGLSYQEAAAQMHFSKKKMAVSVKRALDSARYNAENIHNLNPDRLLVEKKDCWVGKGKYLRRIKMHGRGRSGVMHHPHHHLYVVLREVPVNPAEIRLGRFGRTNRTIRRQMGLEEPADAVVASIDSSSSTPHHRGGRRINGGRKGSSRPPQIVGSGLEGSSPSPAPAAQQISAQ